ncbi:MAG TPA: DUF222 domain-containing protein, partial [Acidimicrobiales bacterium]
ARTWVRVGHALDRYPRWGDSLAEGLLTIDQLSSMVDLVERQEAEAAQPKGPFDDDPEPKPDPSDKPTPDRPTPDQASDDQPSDDTPSSPSDGVLGMAERLSPRQLAAEAYRARQAAARDANELHRRRSVRANHDPGDRKLGLSGELYDDQAATVWSALNDYANGCKADPESKLFDPLACRFADGLVAMAEAYLAARERIVHHPLVIFHADARLLTGDEGWSETSDYSPMAVDTIRRLACSCGVTLSADAPDGNPLFLGRTQYEASWQQVECIRRRDGGCRRCGQPRWIHAHHIREWDAHHGRTDLPNLTGLCSRCHHLVHEGGHRIEGEPAGELRFISPSGDVIRTYPHPQAPPPRRRSPAATGDPPPRPMPPAPPPGRRTAKGRGRATPGAPPGRTCPRDRRSPQTGNGQGTLLA